MALWIINKSEIVAHSTEKMYQLVADVASYPQFIKYCKAASCLELSEDGYRQLWAVTFSAFLSEVQVVTRNSYSPYETIAIALHEGPFKRLEGAWQFCALNAKSTRITLALEVESSILGVDWLVSNAWVDDFASQIIHAFKERAKL